MANALAPKAKNALVQDPLQDLLTKTAAYPQYGELVNFLTSRRLLPEIKQEFLGTHMGEFNYANPVFGERNFPAAGRLSLNYNAQPSTVVHELTHAADRQMRELYFEISDKARRGKLDPLEKQFLDGYKKLSFGGGREKWAAQLAPEWAKEKIDYRASQPELAGYGMASTIRPNTHNPAPMHVDPTMGTEFSILLDLAQRAQNTKPVTDKR
jgi:hypothetical protein